MEGLGVGRGGWVEEGGEALGGLGVEAGEVGLDGMEVGAGGGSVGLGLGVGDGFEGGADEGDLDGVVGGSGGFVVAGFVVAGFGGSGSGDDGDEQLVVECVAEGGGDRGCAEEDGPGAVPVVRCAEAAVEVAGVGVAFAGLDGDEGADDREFDGEESAEVGGALGVGAGGEGAVAGDGFDRAGEEPVAGAELVDVFAAERAGGGVEGAGAGGAGLEVGGWPRNGELRWLIV